MGDLCFPSKVSSPPRKCGKRDLSNSYSNYPVIRFSEGTIHVPPLGVTDGAKTGRQSTTLVACEWCTTVTMRVPLGPLRFLDI